ncbi:hypothetical protein, partial [Bacillus sp. PK30]
PRVSLYGNTGGEIRKGGNDMPKVVRGIEKKRSKAYKLHPKTIELIDRVAKDRGMTQADVINTGVKMLFSERVKIES